MLEFPCAALWLTILNVLKCLGSTGLGSLAGNINSQSIYHFLSFALKILNRKMAHRSTEISMKSRLSCGFEFVILYCPTNCVFFYSTFCIH